MGHFLQFMSCRLQLPKSGKNPGENYVDKSTDKYRHAIADMRTRHAGATARALVTWCMALLYTYVTWWLHCRTWQPPAPTDPHEVQPLKKEGQSFALCVGLSEKYESLRLVSGPRHRDSLRGMEAGPRPWYSGCQVKLRIWWDGGWEMPSQREED